MNKIKHFSFALLCVLLLLGMLACAPQEKTYEEKIAVYSDVVSQYTALLTAKQKGEEITAPPTEGMDERERAITEAIYGVVNRMSVAKDIKIAGYGYKDYDGNGIPELLLCTSNNSVLAIFTISDEKPLLLAAAGDTSSAIYYIEGNRFLMKRTTVEDPLEEEIFYFCHVDGEKLAYDTVYGYVYDHDKEEEEDFKIIDGNRISVPRAEIYDLYNLYYSPIITSSVHYTVIAKLSAPRIHLPLENAPESTDLPVADFSTYEAIRNTCRAISATMDDFSRSKWSHHHYDHLFSCPSESAFAYYNHLIYAAYCGGEITGYDEIDLNGDGQDELVLMDEDYRIKALFTQKNGTPVLLDAFAYETCWLDEDGYIHVDREDYDELEYSLYELTRTGEYKLIYSVLAAANIDHRYLTKDGETKRITFEESLEIYYDDYCRYSEPFEPNEQTRNASSLSFTPLTPAGEDLKAAALTKEWHKYANMTKTSGKDMAYTNTYVTFENELVNFKHCYTFHYPDPDRDHYMLDDTTESHLKAAFREENGVLVFEGDGVKGKIELGERCLWVIIEESTDERFYVGHHAYEKHTKQ